MDTRILVIEDEPDLVQLLRLRLEKEGYEVLTARDGVEGLAVLQEGRPDLIVLDLMLPRMNGWETCWRIRDCSDVPIIILTALTTDQDKVRGLELGADDYITKPFSMKELVARVQAALRRSNHPLLESSVVQLDDRLMVDRAHCRILVDGYRVPLSPTEYKVLSCFLDNAGRILTHQSLLTQVWGWEYIEQTGYLKFYIHCLRQKIERDPRNPRYIVTERGLGYRFQVP
jgi:two-component system KDP operon response regulator KdpE